LEASLASPVHPLTESWASLPEQEAWPAQWMAVASPGQSPMTALPVLTLEAACPFLLHGQE